MSNKKLNLGDLKSISGGNEETSEAIYQMLKSGKMNENQVNQVIKASQAYYSQIKSNPNIPPMERIYKLAEINEQVSDYWNALQRYTSD